MKTLYKFAYNINLFSGMFRLQRQEPYVVVGDVRSFHMFRLLCGAQESWSASHVRPIHTTWHQLDMEAAQEHATWREYQCCKSSLIIHLLEDSKFCSLLVQIQINVWLCLNSDAVLPHSWAGDGRRAPEIQLARGADVPRQAERTVWPRHEDIRD